MMTFRWNVNLQHMVNGSQPMLYDRLGGGGVALSARIDV
jgi:hypothetical protein